jgi:hypothetical protein
MSNKEPLNQFPTASTEVTVEEDRKPLRPGVSGIRGRTAILAMLAMVAVEGCATAPKCRDEFLHSGAQAEYLKRAGCKESGKLSYRCCGDQAKDYDPWGKRWE